MTHHRATGTLASWCIKAGVLLTPLYETMRRVLLTEPLITCRARNVEPYAWRRHVLTELPNRPACSA